MAQRFWDSLEDKHSYIRSYGEGVGTPSRNWLLTAIRDGESLLDVGCGPGCTYENLVVNNRAITYRGIDFAQGFVDACRELFPEGDFRLGDAMALDEPDSSFDTVLLRHVIEHTPHYRQPIAEAFRVARRRVIIVTWRPMGPQPDHIHYDLDGSNDYNLADFENYLHSFLRPMERHEFPGGRPNWAWVIHKRQDVCVFDLDDLNEDAAYGEQNLDLLFSLKDDYPQLKATLFAIPTRSSLPFLRRFSDLPWVELAPHGFLHHPNQECLYWDRETTDDYCDAMEHLGVFVRGFRPPGWQMSEAVLEVLAERGWWVAPNWDDRKRVARYGLPAYYTHWFSPLSVHGHLQDIHHTNPLLRNGLKQLIMERGMPWDGETEFKFVSEVVTVE